MRAGTRVQDISPSAITPGEACCKCSLRKPSRSRGPEPASISKHKTTEKNMIPKNTICLWYNRDALDAAKFYAATFPDSKVTAVHNAPSDYPSGKAGDVLTVEFTVLGIPCQIGRAHV